MKISIIIPVLHERESINTIISHVHRIAGGSDYEIIVVDGAPDSDTIKSLTPGERVKTITAPPGRARQMNAGAHNATGEILLFLHSDTRLPEEAFHRISSIIEKNSCAGGAFSFSLDTRHPWLRFIAFTARLRMVVTRTPYGDQGIFVKKDAFDEVGGFAHIPIMEDVDLVHRIKRHGWKLSLLEDRVTTSPRRWYKEGMLWTTLRNHVLRILYSLGTSPHTLAKLYKNHKE